MFLFVFLRLCVTQKNFAIAFFIFVFLESVFRRTDEAVLLRNVLVQNFLMKLIYQSLSKEIVEIVVTGCSLIISVSNSN